MKVDRITDYFAVSFPVLHLTPEFSKGAYLHYMGDSDSAVISISEEKFDVEKKCILVDACPIITKFGVLQCGEKTTKKR